MKNLEASFNPELKMVAEAKSVNELLLLSESSAMELSVCMVLFEPRTFQEAWIHPIQSNS